MTRPGRYARLEAGAAALVFVLFVGYLGPHVFRYPSPGDMRRHVASVASLYRDFVHPPHEAMAVAGTESEVHTPYIVAVAGMGRAFGISPYRALQVAGILNLCAYVLAICFCIRTFSAVPGSWVPPAAFLFVSAFMRGRVFNWASETSVASLRRILPYPSMLGWVCALVAFACAQRYLQSGGRRWLAVVGAIVWVLVLSHSLTAAWVIVVVGLQGLLALVTQASTARLRSVLWLWGAVAAGGALTTVWPYFDVRRSPSLRFYPEGSPFGDHPFRDMAGLYVAAALAGSWFLWRRRHLFLVVGFATTYAALEMFRWLDYSYGNRFAFFQAFFAQALVADGVAVGVWLACRQGHRLPVDLRPGPWGRVALPAFAVAVLVAGATADGVREEARNGRPLDGVGTLIAAPSVHDGYYGSLGGARERLSAADMVLMPLDHLAWDVTSITGARVVVSRFAYRVPDFASRVADVELFLSPGADTAVRRDILGKYRVSKILLTPQYAGLARALSPCGSVSFSSDAFILIDVAPWCRSA